MDTGVARRSKEAPSTRTLCWLFLLGGTPTQCNQIPLSPFPSVCLKILSIHMLLIPGAQLFFCLHSTSHLLIYYNIELFLFDLLATFSVKIWTTALTCEAQFVGHRPAKQKVAGPVHAQGTYLGCWFGSQLGCIPKATNRCFSLTPMFLSIPALSLKVNKIFKKFLNNPPWGHIYSLMYNKHRPRWTSEKGEIISK